MAQPGVTELEMIKVVRMEIAAEHAADHTANGMSLA